MELFSLLLAIRAQPVDLERVARGLEVELLADLLFDAFRIRSKNSTLTPQSVQTIWWWLRRLCWCS